MTDDTFAAYNANRLPLTLVSACWRIMFAQLSPSKEVAGTGLLALAYVPLPNKGPVRTRVLIACLLLI